MNRRLLGFFAVVVVLLGGLYVAGHFLTGERMPKNASIAGVDVGGMSPAKAVETVDAGLSERADEKVTAVHGGEEFVFSAADLGLSLNAQRSVAAAGGQRTWDPRVMWRLVFGDPDFPAIHDVDETPLRDSILSIADTVDEAVVEPQITFDGVDPVVREPKNGQVVERSELETALAHAWLNTDRPVRIPVSRIVPQATQEAVDVALREIAEPAVSGPVALQVGDKKIDLPATAFAPAVTIEPQGGEMVAMIDAEALEKPLTDSSTGLGKAPVDASFSFDGGKPKVVPGKAGIGLDAKEMAEKLLPVLTKTGNDRSISIDATAVEPEFSTADAQALGITEKISEFTTYFPHSEYRNINQSRAANLINGTILRPGETFSMNDTLGQRTAANGFVEGVVLMNGVQAKDFGGGISQVATTLYNASFFAGLKDVEHRPHSFWISRYPIGREATISWGSIDLRFTNVLENGVVIRTWVKRSTPGSQGAMHVEMWGTKEFDVTARQSERYAFKEPKTRYNSKSGCISQAPARGFSIDIFRDLAKGGKKIRTEKTTTRYIAADRVICGEAPKD